MCDTLSRGNSEKLRVVGFFLEQNRGITSLFTAVCIKEHLYLIIIRTSCLANNRGCMIGLKIWHHILGVSEAKGKSIVFVGTLRELYELIGSCYCLYIFWLFEEICNGFTAFR